MNLTHCTRLILQAMFVDPLLGYPKVIQYTQEDHKMLALTVDAAVTK